MKFAVIDIETTGGSARNERIIEFAAVITDGHQIIDTFQTLVNPNRYIPEFITSLTGIDNQMVQDAPAFEEIAAKIDALTKDMVFVAHSVNFDFSFVKKEFQLLGYNYNRSKLCTVRLSRKIFPGHRSYSLGNICNQLDISISDRHRAFGDAHATAILFNMLVANDRDNHIENSLKFSSKEKKLPPHISTEQYESIPDSAGVYYFFDQKGKIIYIGKAKNLKKRISSHFTISGSLGEKDNFLDKIHSLDFVETGNELIALLMESHEIKKHWPEYNRSQKRPTFTYALYDYLDSKGYRRFTLSKIQKGLPALKTFSSLNEGKNWLYELVKEYELCPKLCGLQPAKEECFDHKIGTCKGACVGKIPTDTYNKQVDRALNHNNPELATFAIVGEGRKYGEKSIVLIDNGTYQGYGFVESFEQIMGKEDIVDRITCLQETPEIKSIINFFTSRKNGFDIIPINR